MTFTGFPESALIFFEGLEADNSKAYWNDHRQQYDDDVRAPLLALLADLEPEFGAAKVFRPYRDIRFSTDKTPYKTQAAAVVDGKDGTRYLALSAAGLFLAGGYWQLQSDQVQRLRQSVADDRSGQALTALLKRLGAAGFELSGEQLQRVPKPWDADHPRADLLRRKSLAASLSCGEQQWLHTAAAVDHVGAAWRQLKPLNAWLAKHVGAHREVRQD